MMQRKSVVVTGVSTGIGKSIAQYCVGRGMQVFGSVRKQTDADALFAELGASFVPLVFDVTDEQATLAAAQSVASQLQGVPLDGLVNNAGIAIGGPLLELPIDEFKKQLEVNLTGLLIATQAFAPLLRHKNGQPGGRVVNMGSVGGRNAFPFMGPYHTSKFGLEGFTDSLRRELMLFGVDVILVAPGSVNTPIWDKSNERDFSAYEGSAFAPALEKFRVQMMKTGHGGIAPEQVAETVYQALITDKPKPYYRITGSPIQFWLMNHLPKRWVDKAVGKVLGLT